MAGEWRKHALFDAGRMGSIVKTASEQRPLVSVLMPVRNGAAYLDEAIASIVSQTFENWELVVVDDGSTDDTFLRLASWAKEDPRIVVINQKPMGLVAASNAAVQAARGVYLARLDSDDIAHPKRLAKQVSYMEKNPDLVVIGSSIRLFGERVGVLFTPLTDWGCRGRLLFENCFAHSSTMIRRSKVAGLVPLYEAHSEFAEDLSLWVRLSSHGKFANLFFPLISYRVHATQTSREKSQILRAKHAKFVVTQWGQMGVLVSPDDFQRFRWPDFEEMERLEVLRHSLRIIRALRPMFWTRYGPQVFWWGGQVFIRNMVKMIIPAARRIL